MRRAAAVAALLALAGCGGGAGGGPAATPAAPGRVTASRPVEAAPVPADPLAALLAARATALQAGDAERYAGTGTPTRRRTDARRARRARRLPLRDVRLAPRDVEVAEGGARGVVTLAYGIRGIAGTFTLPRRIVAASTRDGWRVRSERPGRERAPWEVAAYRVRRSRHFTVLLPAGRPAPGLLRALERGYARTRLGRLPRRVLAVVAADGADAERLTRAIRGVESITALADADVVEQGPAKAVTRVLSRRLLLVWPRFAPLGRGARDRVIGHELTHLALAGETSGRAPAWLTEGVALWSSGDRRSADAARALRDPAALPVAAGARRRALSFAGLARPDAIARLSGIPRSLAYAYSSAAAFHLVERYGSARLLRLLRAFSDPAIAGTDAAMRRELGRSRRAVERDLRADLRGR